MVHLTVVGKAKLENRFAPLFPIAGGHGGARY
jgi:hypothetical protein